MSIEITQVPISKLTLYEKNPRKISKSQFAKLCKSLEIDPRFMLNRPVLVNQVEDKYIVYAGNQRVRAAKHLKWLTVPCVVERDLPENTIRDRVIKDNQHYGEFDFDMLSADYDIEELVLAGFEAEDLIGNIAVDELEVKEGNDGNKESRCNSGTEGEEKQPKICPRCGVEL